MVKNKKASPDILDEFRESLNAIAANEADSLAKQRDLGMYHFEEQESLFQKIIDSANEFLILPLELIPKDAQGAIRDKTKHLADCLNDLAGFRLDKPLRDGQSHQTMHDTYVNSLVDSYEKFKSESMLPVAYLQALLLTNHKKEFSQLLVSQQKEFCKATARHEENLQTIENKSKSVLQFLQEVSAKEGVNKHSPQYKNAVRCHMWISWAWLSVTTILFVFAAVITIYGLDFAGIVKNFKNLDFSPEKIPSDMSDFAIVGHFASKIIAATLVYIMAIGASRNYKAHCHLRVINNQKWLALTTFQTFTNATDDKKIKDAILAEVTRYIFSSSQTGYLGKHEASRNNNIFEILTKGIDKSL